MANVRQLLVTLLVMVAMATGRRSPKLQPAPAIGYQAHKGGPIISLNDKENIIVTDDDGNDDAGVDGGVGSLYDIAIQKGRRYGGHGQRDAQTQSGPARGHDPAIGHGPSQDKLMALVVSLSERVAALQHTLTNIKLQNHFIYRTIKKGYKSCKESANESTIKVAAQKIEKPKCPLGYVVNPDTNMCYKLAAERITWRMARERCRMEDADLVTIETKMEQRWINQLARQSPDTRHCDFWTGATDKNNEGDWRWIANDNALSYSNWNHNEPNNGRGDEHCMQMLWVFNWAWNDARCNYNNACYICELPLNKY